jgi:hypothetical protein
MARQSFLAWASNCLTGHVALFQMTFALPMAVLFMGLDYAEGTLTPGWALWLLGSSSSLSILLAILVFTLVTLPRIRAGGRPASRR